MRAILLIGGFGTRLRPLTLTQPKALLPVLNRPFLSYQLELLQEAKVTDVMLACGKHSRPWKKNLSALAPRKMKIHFAFEPKPLGTGGAIRFAFDQLNKRIGPSSSPVLVFNGDVFFDLPIQAFYRFHHDNQSSCTVALTRVEDPSRFGLVDIDMRGKIRRFIEKPKLPVSTNLINAGAYLLSPDWIETIAENRVVSVERDSFPTSLKAGTRMFGFSMKGYWNDIGTHVSYLAAHRDILKTNNRWTAKLFLRKRGDSKSAGSRKPPVIIGIKSKVSKSTSIEGFLSCGNHVVIAQNVLLHDSVILDGCRIAEGAVIQGAILGRGCRIGAFANIRPGSVLGDKSIIPAYTRC